MTKSPGLRGACVAQADVWFHGNQTRGYTMQQKKARSRARGMTLIEIMVVITIIGLIMAAVGVSVIPQLGTSKVSRARMDFHALRSALTLYYARRGHFPDTGTGLRALVDARLLESVPSDPWGQPYVYTLEKGEPRLVSYGNDGTAGGEGLDADLCSCDPPSDTKQGS